ncbi:transcriptional regulator with XRE-family HTH domain [Rhodoblastus acidophilus]|nr:helix-turn-helix transcriptional regulator [Rhodoblastus acidophilus]MCW2275091.1 transcriptional regulator with XRE-family HTH domain [Rhodoblastus acidophilus]
MDFRKRIKARIEELGLSVAEVERRCGFRPSYIHELLSGKKQTMRGDAMQKLASVLKTSDIWLLRGIGAPDAEVEDVFSGENQNVQQYPEAIRGAKSVDAVRELTLIIDGLTNSTGEVTFRLLGANSAHRGFVADPAFFVADNIFLNSFLTKRAISARAKLVHTNDGKKVVVIVDANELV